MGFDEEPNAAASSHGKAVGGDHQALPDEEIDVLLEELHRYRAELAVDRWASESAIDFSTTALGGTWTKEHTGVDSDAVKGVCSHL